MIRDPARFRRQWRMLADLASWLRASRADHYDSLVAKGRMTEAEALVDRLSREAIDADWRAVAANEPRDTAVTDVRNAWKVRTLEHALAGAEAKWRSLHPQSEGSADWADICDAIACLLEYVQLWPMDPLGCQRITRGIRAGIVAGRSREAA